MQQLSLYDDTGAATTRWPRIALIHLDVVTGTMQSEARAKPAERPAGDYDSPLRVSVRSHEPAPWERARDRLARPTRGLPRGARTPRWMCAAHRSVKADRQERSRGTPSRLSCRTHASSASTAFSHSGSSRASRTGPGASPALAPISANTSLSPMSRPELK
jgi:hypothetical protein